MCVCQKDVSGGGGNRTRDHMINIHTLVYAVYDLYLFLIA